MDTLLSDRLVTGANTHAQQRWLDQQEAELAAGHDPRESRGILQVALVGRYDKRQRRRRTLSARKAFVAGHETEILVLYDAVARGGQDREEPAWATEVQLTERGQLLAAPVRRARDQQLSLQADLSRYPARGGQPLLELDDIQPLRANVWKRGGTFRLRRQGDMLYLCVGTLPKRFGEQRLPAVMYGLPVAYFEGDDPRALLQIGHLPQGDGEVDYGEIAADTVLVQLRKRCRYWQARTDGNQPLYVKTDWLTISPYHSDLPLLLDLRDQALAWQQLPARQRMAERFTGTFPIRVAFPPDVAANLARLAGFTPSPALQQAMVAAIQRRNCLTLLARGGVIRDVEFVAEHPQLLRLVYTDDRQQLLPSSPTLKAVDSENVEYALEPGMTLLEGQRLRCQEVADLDWPTLQHCFDERLAHNIQSYLMSQCQTAYDNTYGQVRLLPIEYVLPVLEQACQHEGQPLWFWDLRDLAPYFAKGAYRLPPFALRERQEQLSLGNLRIQLRSRRPARV